MNKNKIYGILIVSLITALAIFLAHFIGVVLLGFEKNPISPILIAIVLGIILNYRFPIIQKYKSGFSLAIKYVLKLGIVLLGIGISIVELLHIAMNALPVVSVTIVSGLLFAFFFQKIFKISFNLGALIGVGTSICGVTAIVAVSSSIKPKEEETSYAISIVALFGTLTMILYPNLVPYFFEASKAVGIFLGSSIHDTSQAVSAGLIYAEIFDRPEVLEITTVTKLLRNSSLIIVIPFIIYVCSRVEKSKSINSFSLKAAIPLFIIGFIALAVIRSLGDYLFLKNVFTNTYYWESIISGLLFFSKKICLVFAMVAVGLTTSFTKMHSLGYKPLLMGVLIAFLLAFVNIITISIFVSINHA